MKTTLKDVKKEIVIDFDQVFESGKRLEYSRNILVGFLDKVIDRAVEDALEACKPENKRLEREKFENIPADMFSSLIDQTIGWNTCTTQYDENVKSFLEQK